MRISDWSSDVCSSDLAHPSLHRGDPRMNATPTPAAAANADRHVSIFDTSLRDGEQSPGSSMTPSQKLRFAQALADLGVAVIETGFPASSASDIQATRANVLQVLPPTLAALARCHPDDIEASA